MKKHIGDWRSFILKEYYGSLAAGVLCVARDTGKILLSFRSAWVSSGNTWCGIGGKVEEGEDVAESARREFMEEAGYRGAMSLYAAYIFHDRKAGFTYHNFIGVIPKEFVPHPKKTAVWENEAFEWVTLDELYDISPKHFGLDYLLQHGPSYRLLAKYAVKSKLDS